MGRYPLEEVEEYKYLGVQIDNTLSFKVHTKGIIKNVAHKVYILSKIRTKITQHAAALIYESMIMPLLDVGDIFYNSTKKALLKKLDVLQNRALRVIYRLPPRSDMSQVEMKMNILPLHQRRLLHLLQIGRWISSISKFRDHRALCTRAHSDWSAR